MSRTPQYSWHAITFFLTLFDLKIMKMRGSQKITDPYGIRIKNVIWKPQPRSSVATMLSWSKVSYLARLNSRNSLTEFVDCRLHDFWHDYRRRQIDETKSPLIQWTYRLIRPIRPEPLLANLSFIALGQPCELPGWRPSAHPHAASMVCGLAEK